MVVPDERGNNDNDNNNNQDEPTRSRSSDHKVSLSLLLSCVSCLCGVSFSPCSCYSSRTETCSRSIFPKPRARRERQLLTTYQYSGTRSTSTRSVRRPNKALRIGLMHQPSLSAGFLCHPGRASIDSPLASRYVSSMLCFSGVNAGQGREDGGGKGIARGYLNLPRSAFLPCVTLVVRDMTCLP